MTTYSLNNQLNGVEIKFDSKPTTEILEKLHANHWRWSKYKQLWYNKQTEENIQFAKEVSEGIVNSNDFVKNSDTVTEEVINAHGVKIGDIFFTSFGYDMTLVDFYQVVKIMPKSVSVKRINSEVVDGDCFTGKCKPIKDNFTNDDVYTTRTDFSWNGKEKILKNADGRKHIGYEWQNNSVCFNHMD